MALRILDKLAILVKRDASWRSIIHNEAEHIDWFRLTDSVDASNGLILDGWVPVRAGEIGLLIVLQIQTLITGLNLNE